MYLVINGGCVYVLGGRAFEWNIKTLENSLMIIVRVATGMDQNIQQQ